MKLVLYIDRDIPHTKNFHGIQRMCKSCNIDFEIRNDYNQLKLNDYDILLSCTNFINPLDIPNNIKIIMGPHFFVFPEGQIIGKRNEDFSKRCVYNVLSPWNNDVFHEFADDFIVPLVEFPFAVDTEIFKPDNSEKEFDCIVYIKRRSNAIIENTLSLLNSKGLTYKIFKYGNYNEADYITSLQKTKFMLSLDAHESQGFALEEAMSSGVPLLVMDSTSMYDEKPDGVNATYKYLRPKKLLATSVPYWSDECGLKIEKIEVLGIALDYMLKNYSSFTPRDYILRTLSDEVCMKRILDYFRLF